MEGKTTKIQGKPAIQPGFAYTEALRRDFFGRNLQTSETSSNKVASHRFMLDTYSRKIFPKANEETLQKPAKFGKLLYTKNMKNCYFSPKKSRFSKIIRWLKVMNGLK